MDLDHLDASKARANATPIAHFGDLAMSGFVADFCFFAP